MNEPHVFAVYHISHSNIDIRIVTKKYRGSPVHWCITEALEKAHKYGSSPADKRIEAWLSWAR